MNFCLQRNTNKRAQCEGHKVAALLSNNVIGGGEATAAVAGGRRTKARAPVIQ